MNHNRYASAWSLDWRKNKNIWKYANDSDTSLLSFEAVQSLGKSTFIEKEYLMLKFMAVAVAAALLVGGYSYAADSIPTVDIDTVIAHCWGGGWRGGRRGAGWRNGGGWRHGGYRGAGHNQGHYYGG